MSETPSTPQNPEQLDPFYDTEKVASTTECTGLSPAAVLSEEEAESYAELYAVHRQKPVKMRKNTPTAASSPPTSARSTDLLRHNANPPCQNGGADSFRTLLRRQSPWRSPVRAGKARRP